MLTDQQIADEVRRMSYKDGWAMSVFYPDEFQGLYFAVDIDMPNSYKPDETVPLHIESPLPAMTDADALKTWVLCRLIVIETHEALEWFKVDGKMYRDPHDPIPYPRPMTL
jgi:hypothetical protein